MTRLPKVTLVTPTLNQGNFIEKTILSVLDQDYQDLEYIVMDGGSSDQTLEILKKYEGRLKYFSGKDHGQSDAINRGFEKSKGEIMAYLNSDDILLPGSLMKAASVLNGKKLGWVAGKCRVIDEEGKTARGLVTSWKNLWFGLAKAGIDHKKILAVLNFISQPSVFFTRGAWEKAGFFDTELKYSMDLDYWFRLGKFSEPVFLDDCLSAFRIHKTSKTSNDYKKQMEESLLIVKKHYPSKFLLSFRKLHDLVTSAIYKYIN